MSQNRYHIALLKCAETGVYVGTSDDIPGLTLEAATQEELIGAIQDIVPELLIHNCKIPEEKIGEMWIEVAYSAERGSENTLVQPRSQPRILVEHSAAFS